MRKRPRLSLSLIVAETVRSGQESSGVRTIPRLVSADGTTRPPVPEHAVRAETHGTDLLSRRLGHGFDAVHEFSNCRDWAELMSAQQRWAERTRADYAEAFAQVAGAAIRMVTGATATPTAR